MTASKPEDPDRPPKHLYIGAINPFALCEAILGRKLDWRDPATANIMSSILQTDYEELFDMRFRSILYAGIQLNDRGDMAELIPAKDMHTLTERDLVTPDFSKVEKLGDLDHVGLKDINAIKVKHAFMSNGNLRLTLQPQSLGKTICSSEMTTTLRELATPFRIHKKEEWVPPNSTWTDIGESCYRQHTTTMFSNPVQGATSNSWLIAAMMAVAWSDPSAICHHHHDRGGKRESRCSLSVRFHSKGGDNDAPTSTVTVNCEVPTNNSSSLPVYCRPSSMMMMTRGWAAGGEIWPCLYEKAFAKWIIQGKGGSDSESGPESEHPDLTQTCYGDPVKCAAQLTGKEPQYFFTSHRRAQDLLGLVRTHCFNLRTIYPFVAFTHPTGDKFRGCTLVANMAYTVLGWAAPQERKQYIILRHPWGVTEPEGMTGYPGLVSCVDVKFWPPVELVDGRGVFAIETSAFKEYFAGMGVAK
ncbi:cysteine proteinase [Canariomyces notabilis]|uniref:Cysteine proteinase n=1 Tax=Canariomyces notabilis TaxID=2074819 RepID=A0AAN6YYG5_9PEZI|nr:cysteine proteinase [Canariomyces arenarius]